MMNEIQVSMTELRQRLGNLVNRAAYGSDRIILVAHGEPKAAIISVQELQRLRQLGENLNAQSGLYTQALAKTDLIRERVRQWQEEHRIEPEDSTDTLNRLRAERDDELGGLR